MKSMFWKNHRVLRFALMALFFVAGLILNIVGWKMTGQAKGLHLMLWGLALLLSALFLYNKPYQ